MTQITPENPAPGEPTDELARLHQKLDALTDKLTALHKATDSRFAEIRQRLEYSRTEIEAYQQLLARLGVSGPAGSPTPVGSPAPVDRLLPPLGGWPLDARSAVQLLDLLDQHRPTRIFELGSGSSTVLLGHHARRVRALRTVQIYSFDHLPGYLAQTQRYLDLHELNRYVDLQLAPLTAQAFPEPDLPDAATSKTPAETGTRKFTWYDLSTARLPDEPIDLLLIDGPPARTGPHARYPAVPALFDRIAPGGVIVLDDGVRKEERDIARAWVARYPELIREEPDLTALIVLRKRATD